MTSSDRRPRDRAGVTAADRRRLDAQHVRQRYERRQRRRSAAVAIASTVVVVGLLVWLVPKTSGWENVQQSFFNPEAFRDVFPELLGPFWYDVQIFLWCAPCIVVVGLLIAIGRGVRAPALYPVRLFATLYIDIVRGVPVILWITLLGFGVPGLLQTREWYGKFIVWGSVALVVTYSAYVAEVFRAGIESVHESQRAAARSLGLTVGPDDARRRAAPGGAPGRAAADERPRQPAEGRRPDQRPRAGRGAAAGVRSRSPARSTSRPYVAAAVLFLCVSIPLTRLTDHLLQRERRRDVGDGRCDEAASCEGVVKEFGDHRVLDGIDLDVDAGEVIALIGASGSRQEHAAALRQPARADRRRADPARRRRHQRARSRPRPGAAAHRAWCSRASTCSPT